jgi:hypothetical protein
MMRSPFCVSVPALLAVLACSPMVLAQSSSSPYPPGWLPCPRCQSGPERAASRKQADVENRTFDPKDIAGVWGNNGMELSIVPPPFTAKGKELYDATRADETPEGLAISNSKDGMLICDPLGYPRLFAYNYGFEFVVLPNRVVQFFEFGHTWRDIWTDGRKLPDDPPQPRWMGYAIGRWEGDTFVVESNGYDDRSWIQEDRRDRRWGFPPQRPDARRRALPPHQLRRAERVPDDFRPGDLQEAVDDHRHDSAQPGYGDLGIHVRRIGVGGLQQRQAPAAGGG